MAWACMGDFNAIIHHHAKEGGKGKSQVQMDEFNEMRESIHMEDLGAKGSRLMWSNNRRGEERISEHIGLVHINESWVAQYPNIQFTNDNAIGSNHMPSNTASYSSRIKKWTPIPF